jgi:hypothetical protein
LSQIVLRTLCAKHDRGSSKTLGKSEITEYALSRPNRKNHQPGNIQNHQPYKKDRPSARYITEPSTRKRKSISPKRKSNHRRMNPYPILKEKTTEPNQSLQTTIMAVTDRAPSSTLRASHDRV